MLLASPQAHAQAPAGTVEFVSGGATIRSAAGQSRPAVRGANVGPGDTVETALGRLQLSMIDGAFISLQPQTSLRIDEYAIGGSAGRPESGLLGLLRGGLRTVTGAIGSINRPAYRLTTPTATVGIRGTEFAASADEGTRVNVTDGTVALCNEGGCIDVGAGQSGFAPDRQTRPALAFAAARLPPTAAGEPQGFVVAERRNDSGGSASIPGGGGAAAVASAAVPIPLANGPGPFPIIVNTTTGGFAAGVIGGTQTFNGAGALTQFTDCCSGGNLTAGVSPDSGADGIIAWGRWTGGISSFSGANGTVSSVQYIGALNATAATVPIVKGFASFASSAPTIVNGAGALVAVGTPNSVTGSMNVNFTGGSGGSLTYNLSIPVASQVFTVNGSASQYVTTAFLGSSSSISSSGSLCVGGCVGTIPFGNAFSGVITGAGATRAGGVYGFTSTLGKVSGAVVFK